MEKEILFERLSVSDIVLEVGNKYKELLFKYIQDNVHGHYMYVRNLTNPIKEISGILYLEEPIFDTIKAINFQFFCFQSLEDVRKTLTNFNYGAFVNFESSYINIVTYGIKDDLNSKHFNQAWFHEIHHIFQNVEYDKSVFVKEIYSKALSIINNKTIYGDSNSLIYKLAYCIYYFDKTEIDANMQSLYQELKTFGQKNTELANSTNIILGFEIVKSYFEDLKKYKFNDVIKEHVRITYKTEFEKLLKYIQRRIFYFEDKKRRVITRYMEEQKLLQKKKIMENFIHFL